MDRRVLRRLRFVVEPRRPFGPPALLTIEPGSGWKVLLSDKPTCDVVAGDVTWRAISIHEVFAVVIGDDDAPDQIDRVVTSGRAWLGGE